MAEKAISIPIMGEREDKYGLGYAPISQRHLKKNYVKKFEDGREMIKS